MRAFLNIVFAIERHLFEAMIRLGSALIQEGERRRDNLIERRTPDEAMAVSTKLRDELQSGGEDYMISLPPLDFAQHALIGKIVQVMNFVDFNARRALEIIDIAHADGHLSPEPRDNELLSTLSKRIATSPLPQPEIIEAQRRLNDLIAFQRIRNHLAHWMARRSETAEALVVWTKNGREGPRKAGTGPHGAFGTTFAVIPLDEVRINLPVMINHHEWLGQAVGVWFARYVNPA